MSRPVLTTAGIVLGIAGTVLGVFVGRASIPDQPAGLAGYQVITTGESFGGQSMILHNAKTAESALVIKFPGDGSAVYGEPVFNVPVQPDADACVHIEGTDKSWCP